MPGTINTMWAADTASALMGTNLYGSHPFYVSLGRDGSAHGVFMRNGNGMDIFYFNSGDSLHPIGDYLTYKIIGGAIDLYLFTGSRPADVTRQYQAIVGKPMLQPYWALGFHQCRYGYKNIDEAIDVVRGYKEAEIPLEVAWLDIDYMSSWLDFTFDEVNFPSRKVAAFVDELHSNGQKFVPIVDPGILAVDKSWNWAKNYRPYYEGMEADIFIKDVNGVEPYMGQVWPGPVHWPDWFHPNATDYWTTQLRRWHDVTPFDGLWVDMNEASNFCSGQVRRFARNNNCQTSSYRYNIVHLLLLIPSSNVSLPLPFPPFLLKVCKNTIPQHCPTRQQDTQTMCCLSCTQAPSNKLEYPPYNIANGAEWRYQHPNHLGYHTVPPSAMHYGGLREYDVHNMYGSMEAKATSEALESIRKGKRSFVLSRSSFPGHGKHASHWTGDNKAAWIDLQKSIVTVNDFAMFGISMVGSDICGFIEDSWEELCARWIQVGAFHPFSRNHNTYGAVPQELYRWDSVARSARSALGMRYKLLPYIYTSMWKAASSGDLVSNYLWNVFPHDEVTHDIDRQFMLGDAILVSPVLDAMNLPGTVSSLNAYFPEGVWHNIFDYSKKVKGGQWVTLSVALDEVNAHIRGGKIIAMQGGGATTAEARSSRFTIVVSLDPDEERESTGELYLDDGESIDVEEKVVVNFSSSDGYLKSESINFHNSGSKNDALGNTLVEKVVVIGVKSSPQSCVLPSGGKCKFAYDGKSEILTINIDEDDKAPDLLNDFYIKWG